MESEQTTDRASVRVRNIGGIDETEVAFSPGVTVLKGENATNRTSMLQAVMAALGSDDISIKGDADEARVELELSGERYVRELSREGTTIQTDGNPYLEDPTVAELFAFLLETNDARRAVMGTEDLRELIMRPVDTDEIKRRIDQLVEDRRELEQQLADLDSLKERLPSLEERRAELRDEIETVERKLETKEAEIDARDADVEETREEQQDLEERLEKLRSKRADLEDVRYDLETERDGLESLRTEKREAKGELEGLPETQGSGIEDLVSERDRLRERKRRLESEVNELQSVIGFNQEMLEEADSDILDALNESDDVTDDLLPEETVTCWTCGSDVPEDQIESTVSQLQELSQSKLGEVRDIESRIEELSNEVEERRTQQRRREDVERRIAEAEREIEDSETTIEHLTERRDALRTEIEDLEDEIEALENEAYEEILDLHKDANQLEYELGRLEGDLEDVEDEIADIEARLDEESELREQRSELGTEIQELRTRIDRIESQAIESFNEHMDTVLEKLQYSNLERIWLERVERDVREGRRKVSKRAFELHIVRTTESGATYEDTIDHLSESEREVTGLVFALAGYLVHEVYDDVPFMLLDSLEAIDADRIARLVEYVEEYSDYLLVAALPEDAAALPDRYERITEI